MRRERLLRLMAAQGREARSDARVYLTSTFMWQRRLHSEMAVIGYDEMKVRRLVTTNWIRTVTHLLIAVLAIVVLKRGV